MTNTYTITITVIQTPGENSEVIIRCDPYSRSDSDLAALAEGCVSLMATLARASDKGFEKSLELLCQNAMLTRSFKEKT